MIVEAGKEIVQEIVRKVKKVKIAKIVKKVKIVEVRVLGKIQEVLKKVIKVKKISMPSLLEYYVIFIFCEKIIFFFVFEILNICFLLFV